MRVFRQSSLPVTAALLLAGVSLLGAVEHQIETGVVEAARVTSAHAADCEPEQAVHLDPRQQAHHECLVCRIGPKGMRSTSMQVAGSAYPQPWIPPDLAPVPATRRPKSAPSRAPPTS